MTLTPSAEDGFVLAALLAGDRTLQRVEGAISAELVAKLRQRTHTGDLSRTQIVSALLERVRPSLRELSPSLPARVVALLADRLPQQSARALAPAPRVRAGFRPPSDLQPLLLRLARAANEAGGRR